MRILLLLLLLIWTGGCASRQPQEEPKEDCAGAFVILPGNFIIDLAAGATVLVDPSVQDFALFCTPAQAQEALAHVQPPGDWRVYELAGDPAELAKPQANGPYLLSRPAQVKDWLAAH